MSAPESSSSKERPSLLSAATPGTADNSPRILASLEGRVVAQQAARRPSEKPWAVAALAVVGFSAFGAWQWQRAQRSEQPVVAAAVSAVKTTSSGARAS